MAMVVGIGFGSRQVEAKTGSSHAPEAFTLPAELERQIPDFAVLFGRIENYGLPTGWRFRWGPTKAYGHITDVPEERAYDGTRPVFVESVIEGFKPNQTYHYRLIAFNAAGKSVGRDRTFHTPSR
jgi:phosphodiesterase/alkaline phosphatase D-like protein